jgi:YesN/AraC family two-component response regulator
MNLKSSRETSYIYDVFCNCVLSYNILENNFGIIPNDIALSTFQSDDNMPYTTNHYPETLPQNLVYSIKTGDKNAALDCLRLIYEKTYLLESGNFNTTKIRLIEILHYLSRSISADILTAPFYVSNIEKLHNTYSFSEFYKNAQILVAHLTENLFSSVYNGDSPVIKNAVTYINTYYNLNITLASAAKSLNVNASYLSTLFKKEMQKTFSEYLLEVRLNNSIRLLLSTHMSITDIAFTSGFSNQSYFIKMFKRNYGMTPAQYRKNMK